MTYEDKLDLIISEIVEAKKRTRTGQPVKIFVIKNNELVKKIIAQEIHEILLKFQDDEKIITIKDIPHDLKSSFANGFDDNYDHFLVEVLETFDDWYKKYLMGQKSNLENLDFINMLRIYDVVLDINEQIQLTNKTDIYIHLIPSLIRFQALFPADTIGLRDQYCENRLGGLKYLKNKGAIDNYSYGSSGWSWDSNVEISLRLSAFDNFYKTIRDKYTKRYKANKKTKKLTKIPTETDQKEVPAKVTYDPKKGTLDISGKSVKLNKDSFRAKLLELLLKDDKSIKKEWSWDEVIEKIEGTLDLEATKENKKKFYPACDGLSKFIAQKIGVNDLLIFNKSTVQINSKYL